MEVVIAAEDVSSFVGDVVLTELIVWIYSASHYCFGASCGKMITQMKTSHFYWQSSKLAN